MTNLAAYNLVDRIAYPGFVLLLIAIDLLKIQHGATILWLAPSILIQLLVLSLMVISRSPNRVRIVPAAFLGLVFFHAFLFFDTSPALFRLNLLGGKIYALLIYFYTGMLLHSYTTLGRNLGMLPAVKEIAVRGLYGKIRHPLYAIYFCISLINLYVFFSALNLFLFTIFCVGIALRVREEEAILNNDLKYSEYSSRVRRRFFSPILATPPVFLIIADSKVQALFWDLLHFFMKRS